jgi:membrane protein involved in colicin uptake
MAVQGKVVYETELDASGAVKGYKELEKGAQKSGSAIKTAFKEGGGGIIGTLNELTGGLASKFKDVFEALGGVTKGFGALKGAIIASGVGALLIVIGTLISRFAEIKQALNLGVNPATAELAKTTKEAAEQSKKALEAFDLEERKLRALGTAEEDLIAIRKERLNQSIQADRAELEARKKVLQDQIAAISQAAVDSVTGNIFDKAVAGIQSLFLPSEGDLETAKQELQAIESQLAEKEVQVIELDAKAKKIETDRRTERIKVNDQLHQKELAEEEKRRTEIEERQKKFEEERLAAEIERQNELIELDRAIADARLALVEDEQQKQINAVTTKYDELFELAKGDAERTRELQFLQNTELAKINAEFRQKELDANAEAEAKKKADAEARIQNDVALTQSGIDALIALNEQFEGKSDEQRKKAFKRNKALKIAQTLITTYQNATAAYASQLTIPSPDAPARAAIASGVAIAQGLAQVAAISKQKYSGGESGGGGSAGGAPSFSGGGGGQAGGTPFAPVNTSFIQNVPTAQPVQAYVLTTSVTSGQHAQQKIEELSTL